MNPRVPNPPRLPDRMPKRGNFVVPLAINLGLMLALYLATADTSAAYHSLKYLVALGGLTVITILATVAAALAGYSRTAMGLGLSILLIFLVGLGSCALTLQNS